MGNLEIEMNEMRKLMMSADFFEIFFGRFENPSTFSDLKPPLVSYFLHTANSYLNFGIVAE